MPPGGAPDQRRKVLEMVVHGQPLAEILSGLAHLIEAEHPDVRAAALLREGPACVGVAPGLPESFRLHLEQNAEQLLSAEGLPGVNGTADATDPVWRTVLDAAADHDLRNCWWTAIRSPKGPIVGLMLLLRRDAQPPTAEQLALVELAGQVATIAAEQHRLVDQLTYQAQHDSLTSLPNRELLADRLRHALAQARRSRRSAGLFVIDVDRFKVINDTLGHPQGDLILQELARRWKGLIRETDTLVRMGGDEFTLVAPELLDHQDAVRVARRLLEALNEPVNVAGREVFLTISVGIGIFPMDGTDGIALQKNAEIAMYQAKSQGGNRFQCFTQQMNVVAHERMELESELRRAIEHRQLVLHYQPQVDTSGHLVAVEALVRWDHPQRGMLPPARFIHVAEQCGLIVPLGAWVLREACQQAKQWQQAGCPPVRVAVNVSAMQFAQPDFVTILQDALAHSGLAPRWLELELTESMLMQDTADAARKLASIRELGVGVAIDDFGTGYSSLAYLQRLPIDTLKIDQSFVREIGERTGAQSDTAVIRAIASLAQSLGLSVVAEGVETDHQRQFLREIGCTGMQGYIFSPPVPPQQIEAMLRQLQPAQVAISA